MKNYFCFSTLPSSDHVNEGRIAPLTNIKFQMRKKSSHNADMIEKIMAISIC